MPRIKNIKVSEFEQFVIDAGYTFERQKGSHKSYRKKGMPRPIIIPKHHKTLSIGTVTSNLRTMGLSPEALIDYLSGKR